MADFARLMPQAPVPPLRVGTVGGPCWRLCDQKPKNFTLVVFYRGLHCSACKAQLRDLEANIAAFRDRGVRVIAVSADSRDRAERTAEAWGIEELTLCWGLTFDQARAWGLYVSEGRGRTPEGLDEPPFFVEPALFLVRPDNTLYAGILQTLPFVRPHAADILAALDAIIAGGEAPRGGATGIDRHAAE